MLKRKLLALLLVATILIPTAALADESSSGCKKTEPVIEWTLGLPFKVIGGALAGATGLLVGTGTGLVRGAVKGTKAVAGALGDEDGAGETLAGIIFGAAPGAVVHAVVGGLLWTAKGLWAGLEKPLHCNTINSAFEGIPDAIEWTAEGASKEFS